jgi:hypothetical protein
MVQGALDPRFFEKIESIPPYYGGYSNGNVLIESYESVFPHSTLLLYSRKTAAPLAALTLTTDDPACLSMFTARPAPNAASESYFQGMINMANKAFDLTISNLSDRGNINFNILRTPYRVSSTDSGPSYGLNEVNELTPNHSYTITADQRNNRRMLLKGRTKAVNDPYAPLQAWIVPLTVEESEQDGIANGLYFSLSVAPDASCPTLVNQFAEGTVWKVAPGFVRKVKVPHRPMVTHTWRPHHQRPQRFQLERTRAIRSYGSLPEAPPHAPSSPRKRREKCPLALASMKSLDDSDDMFETTRSISRRPAMKRWSDNDRVDDAVPRRHSDRASMPQIPGIGSTQAARLFYGEQVDVRSVATRSEYDFDKASEPTVLCMSIWEEMELLPIDICSFDEELREQAEDYIKNRGQNMIDSLNAVYKIHQCVVDFRFPADTIICSCGHQCLNHVNVNKVNMTNCPLCRSPISAFLRADGAILK